MPFGGLVECGFSMLVSMIWGLFCTCCCDLGWLLLAGWFDVCYCICW